MNDDQKINLNRFNMNSIERDATILIYGKRRSGKSWLIRDMCYHLRDIPYGVVFSGTEAVNEFYSDFIPDSFIHNKYDRNLINNMFAKQTVKIKTVKSEGKGDGKTAENNMFVFMDDMISQKDDWKKDDTIREIGMNGRHYNILFCLATQHLNSVPTDLRGNIDYVFMFNDPSINNRKILHQNYGAVIPKFEMFCTILDECTQDYQCLVVKTTGILKNTIESQVFYYKAVDHGSFHMGSKQIWDFHQNNYDKMYKVVQTNDKLELAKRSKRYLGDRKRLQILVSKNDDVEVREH